MSEAKPRNTFLKKIPPFKVISDNYTDSDGRIFKKHDIIGGDLYIHPDFYPKLLEELKNNPNLTPYNENNIYNEIIERNDKSDEELLSELHKKAIWYFNAIKK